MLPVVAIKHGMQLLACTVNDIIRNLQNMSTVELKSVYIPKEFVLGRTV